MILALGATVWIALPVVLLVLHGFHRLVGGRLFAASDESDDSPPPGG